MSHFGLGEVGWMTVDKGGDWLCLNGSSDVFTGIGNTVATFVGFFRLLLGVIRAYENKVSISNVEFVCRKKNKHKYNCNKHTNIKLTKNIHRRLFANYVFVRQIINLLLNNNNTFNSYFLNLNLSYCEQVFLLFR